MSARKKRKNSAKLKLLFVVAITTALLIFLDSKIRPLVKSVAESQAKTITTEIINDEIINELSGKSDFYSNLANIKTDENGKVLAILADSQKINLLKSAVSLNIQKRMPTFDPIKTPIPIGSFSGTEILMGKGPNIKMQVSIPSVISSRVESDFTQAGINQTKYRMYIFVEAEVYALIPGFPVSTTVSTNVLISEIVVVGDVPQLHPGIGPKELAKLDPNQTTDFS